VPLQSSQVVLIVISTYPAESVPRKSTCRPSSTPRRARCACCTIVAAIDGRARFGKGKTKMARVRANKCSCCKAPLTSANAPPSVVRLASGYCVECSKKLEYQKRETHPARFILRRAKGNAKERGIECTLTLADIPTIPEVCPIFPWIKLRYRVGAGRRAADDAPSLDRIDNAIGYVRDNVRIISHRANILKRDANFRELIALADHPSGTVARDFPEPRLNQAARRRTLRVLCSSRHAAR
jgi:hypothetical protein